AIHARARARQPRRGCISAVDDRRRRRHARLLVQWPCRLDHHTRLHPALLAVDRKALQYRRTHHAAGENVTVASPLAWEIQGDPRAIVVRAAMTSDLVVVSRDGPIATIVLNRQQKLNALTKSMWRALGAAVTEISADDSLRCVIVRGAGEK